MNIKTLSASLLLVALTSLSSQANETIDKMVAQVDEDVILQSELDRKIDQAKKQILAQGGQLPPEDVLQKELLNQLILQRIQIQMALRVGVQVSEAELQHFAGQVAQQNSSSLAEFRLKLAQEGTPFEVFLEDLRNEILTSRVREGMVKRRIKISEKEIDSLIQTIDADSNIQYHLGHILISVPEGASESQTSELRSKALQLKADIEAGADFAETARNHSSSPDATSGGDFGWKNDDSMPSLFSEVVYYMDKGDISQLIKSPSGFHILKLIDKTGEEQHMVNQVHARHILIIPDAITSEKDAESLLTNLRQQILSGDKDFENLAKEYSKDPGSANIGGDLGWQSPNIYDPAFKEVLSSLSMNQISEPFQSEFGWHIVQFLGQRQDDQTDEMKKDQAAAVLQKRKYTEEVENWLREIRDEAYVQKIVEDKSGS